MAPTALAVALDWTPNTNHVGFYIAKAKGWYAEVGLDVTLLSPHHDAYKRTPASRVADGSAAFAVTPTETVISSHTLPAGRGGAPLVAVAALQQRNTSAIVTLKASGRDTPAKLDGANYASYGARYEGRIVQQMIKVRRGSGRATIASLARAGVYNAHGIQKSELILRPIAPTRPPVARVSTPRACLRCWVSSTRCWPARRTPPGSSWVRRLAWRPAAAA